MKRRLLPLALILLAAVLFAPLCRSFVREVVVIPFLYIFWIIRFFLEAVPQITLWFLFVALLVVIFLAGFIDRRSPGRKARPPATVPKNRIESWAILIQQAKREDYFKWRLGQQLQKVALQLMAHQKSQTISQTRQQLRQDKLQFPPEVQAYFEASLQPLGYLAPPKRLFFRTRRPPSPLDLDPGQIATFLENQFDGAANTNDHSA